MLTNYVLFVMTKKKWKSRRLLWILVPFEKKLRSWRKTILKSPKFISHMRSNSRNAEKYQPRYFPGSVALINNYTWYIGSICDTYLEEYLYSGTSYARRNAYFFSRGYSSYRVWNSQFTIHRVKNRKKKFELLYYVEKINQSGCDWFTSIK